MQLSFAEAWHTARHIEQAVADWLMRRGWFVLPVYDYSGQENDKAPKLQAWPERRSLILPDLLVVRSGLNRWVEVKYKTRADFTRLTGRYETGIDARHWQHYCEVQRETGLPVWLVFAHRDEDSICGRSIDELKACLRISRQFNCGRGGVFFPLVELRSFARLSDVLRSCHGANEWRLRP